MNSFVTTRKVFVAAALVAVAAPQLVNASVLTNQSQPTTVHVQITDLNLANSAGIDALHARLSNAARSVCGSQSDLKVVGSLKQLRINKVCYDNTLAQALAEVNYPSVAQVHTQ